MTDAQTKQLREGWRSFTGALQAAEQLIGAFPGVTADELAVGYRYVAAYARMILEYALANSDTDHPYFMVIEDHFTKFGLDNVDNLYGYAQIRGDGDYRITGNRGNVSDLVITVQEGDLAYWSTGRVVGHLDLDRLIVDDNGDFEIIVSHRRRDGNWLPNVTDVGGVLIRQCLADWDTERPQPMYIERIDRAGAPSQEPGPELVAERLEHAGRLLLGSIAYWRDFMQSVPGRPGTPHPVNEMTEPMAWGRGVEGVPSQLLSVGEFALDPDEALVLSFDPGQCRYLGVMLSDVRWYTSFDYRNRQSSLTGAQIRRNRDGRANLVVAHHDPGLANWLDTTGHRRGHIYMRWQGISVVPSSVQTRVVRFDELARELPEEPRVSPEERRAILAARKRAVDRRFFP